jgi:hypothetical protein
MSAINYLTLVSTIVVTASGTPVPPGYINIASTNSAPTWANSISTNGIQGSTIVVSSITMSTITGSTLTASAIGYSTLSGSTITSNNLVLSTLTVSSINNGTPGVAAYSTFNASSINVTSTITTSTLTVSAQTELGNRLLGLPDASPTGNFWLGLRGSGTEGDRLAIAIQGNPTTGSVSLITLNKPTNTTGNFTKLGTTVGNDLRIEGGTATNSGYVNFVHSSISRGYIGNATAIDMDLVAQNGAKLNFWTAGTKQMEMDTLGTINVFNIFRKSNNVNPTQSHITIHGGNAANTPYIDFTLDNVRKGYIGWASATTFDLSAEAGSNLQFLVQGGVRMTINTAGLTTMNNGLSVAGGAITCANQPFVIVGGVAGANIAYTAGTNFGSSGNLFAYTSAGYSNSSGSGWESSTGRFWATITGRYQVNFTFFWNGFTAGSRAVMRHFNSGGSLLEDRYCAASSVGHGTDTVQTYSTIVYMSAGSYLEFNFQSGGGTLFFGGIIHTHCSFHFIA